MQLLGLRQIHVAWELAFRSFVAVCFLLPGTASPIIVRGDDKAKESAPGEVQWSVEASHTVLPAPGQNFWVRMRHRSRPNTTLLPGSSSKFKLAEWSPGRIMDSRVAWHVDPLNRPRRNPLHQDFVATP